MHLRIAKEKLLELLSCVASVVERRHTLNILSNIKITLTKNEITLIGSDLEVELIAKAPLNDGDCIEAGETTIPARKLLDICKALPNQAIVDLELTQDERCLVKSQKSKFALGTLPAEDFPLLFTRSPNYEAQNNTNIEIKDSDLKRLFEKTAFAMAVQDVRFYLTGTLLEIDNNILRAIATDGHRMALCEATAVSNTEERKQAIIPKKAVSELQRLLSGGDTNLKVAIGRELLNATINLKTKEGSAYSLQFTTKLIDGKYPDYRRVIPTDNDIVATIDHSEFKQAINRVSILSNEKLKGIVCNFSEDLLELRANNPEQDEAVEDFAIDFKGDEIEISFSSQYLSDVMNVINNNDIQVVMAGGTSGAVRSVLIKNPNDPTQTYVIMPMRI